MKQINYVLGDTGSEFVMGFFGAILKRFLDKLGNFVGNNIKILGPRRVFNSWGRLAKPCFSAIDFGPEKCHLQRFNLSTKQF